MADSTASLARVVAPLRQPKAARWLLLAMTLASLATAALADAAPLRQAALAAGLTLGFILLVQAAAAALARRRARVQTGLLLHLVGQDAAPCVTADITGRIGFRNGAAQARLASAEVTSLVSLLKDHVVSPSAVVYRLQNRAAQTGAAREDVATRRGHLRLSVHRLDDTWFLWRLEEFQDRGDAGRGAETLSLPMLTANRAGIVLFTNEAMRRLLGGRPKRLDRVFASQVLHSGEEVEVSAAEGPVRAILAEVEGLADRREIYLLPVPSRPVPAGALTDFDHLPVPLLKFSPRGELLAANAAARDLLRLTGTAVVQVHDLFEGLGRPVADWLADVAAERLPGSAEVVSARTLGGDNFLQVVLCRHVESGRPGVLAVLQDATALKKLEAQFVQSQKMQAIGQLAGGVAHDFNNLLTAISGHCDLLLLRHRSDETDYGDLIQIHQNANRAAALVSQLLAFSRKQTLKPQELDLQEVLSDLAHLLNRLVGERIDLQFTHGSDLGPVRADKRQFEQVVMNLVVNARDAMPAGGRIGIQTEAVTLRAPLLRDRATVPAGDYALIRVSDSGCGIAPDRLSKIFEPFYTTKKPGEGTGLGLSTAYGIVKQSGGYIFVDSSEGEGTIFQLYFPICAAAETTAAVAPPRQAGPLRPGEGVVLLVEDEAPVRAFASRALRLKGFTVLEAEDAETALKTLEDPTLKVDVFVTDVVMPGMDGPTWVRKALADRPEARVIFVSGYAEESLAEGQARVPNSVFLPKPFSLADLAMTVQGQMQ